MEKIKKSLIVCLILLIPSLANLRVKNSLRHTIKLQVPKTEWTKIIHKKADNIIEWEKMNTENWIFTNPKKSQIAQQINTQKIKKILNILKSPLVLERVITNIPTKQELNTYGLSEELQIQLQFQNSEKNHTFILGYLTPSRDKIYILHENHIYKCLNFFSHPR